MHQTREHCLPRVVRYNTRKNFTGLTNGRKGKVEGQKQDLPWSLIGKFIRKTTKKSLCQHRFAVDRNSSGGRWGGAIGGKENEPGWGGGKGEVCRGYIPLLRRKRVPSERGGGTVITGSF